MNFTPDQKKSEIELEKKYFGVLFFVDAKEFLKKTPYTSAKISGAIGRFCRAEDAEIPSIFLDMETFVNDFCDFWLDANPEVHELGETVLNQAVTNYVAYQYVWAEKCKRSLVFTPEYLGLAGKMSTGKSALAVGTRFLNSRISHCKGSGDIEKAKALTDFRESLPEAVTLSMPIIEGLEKGRVSLPEGETLDDLMRLLAAYFSGDVAMLNTSKALKLKGDDYKYQIEYKEVVNR